MLKNLFWLLILLNLAGCSSKSIRPTWIIDLPHSPSLYQAVGVASKRRNAEESWKVAEQNAREALAAQIKTDVQVITNILNISIKKEQRETLLSSFQQITNSVVNETLPETKIKERYYDKNTGEYWALAVVEKAVIERTISQKVERSQKLILEYYNAAHKQLSSGQIAMALKEYEHALTEASQGYMKFMQMDIDNDGKQEYPFVLIEQEINDVLGKIRTLKSKIKLAVKILEESYELPTTESIVENKIAAVLVENGYKLEQVTIDNSQIDALLRSELKDTHFKPEADIFIIGKAEATYSSQNLGYFFSYRSRVVLKGIDVRVGKIVIALDIANVKGFGDTKQKAKVDSYEKVAIETSKELLKRIEEYYLTSGASFE
jgi:hypothetical protein